jgi:hypothetical protein
MSKSNSIIIFDWDDTLFPTYHLNNNNIIGNIIPSDFQDNLNILSNIIINILDNALTLANVIIITNAQYEWIDYSSNIYLPQIYEYLNSKNIEKISARDYCNDNLLIDDKIIDNYFEYYDLYSSAGESLLWKKITFQNYFINNKFYNNIISIGDSECERFGLLNIKLDDDNIFRKSFKLNEKPNISLIIKELEYITKNLNVIVNYDGNLDIGIYFQDIV